MLSIIQGNNVYISPAVLFVALVLTAVRILFQYEQHVTERFWPALGAWPRDQYDQPQSLNVPPTKIRS
jgi:hypothetical protein